MEKGFKKSLGGYLPQDVEDKLNRLTSEFEDEYERLEREYSSAMEENRKSRERLLELESKLNKNNELYDRLSKILVNAHIDASNIVFEAKKKSEKMENDKKNEILAYEKRNAELKVTIKKLMEDIQSILNKYKY